MFIRVMDIRPDRLVVVSRDLRSITAGGSGELSLFAFLCAYSKATRYFIESNGNFPQSGKFLVFIGDEHIGSEANLLKRLEGCKPWLYLAFSGVSPVASPVKPVSSIFQGNCSIFCSFLFNIDGRSA